jgi:hypothetical protein
MTTLAPSLSHPVKDMLKPYLDKMIKEVFAKNAREMKQLLSAQLRKQQEMEANPLNNAGQLAEVAEMAAVMNNYMASVETVLDMLTEKCAEEIYFDTYHWEQYKQIQTQNRQLQEDNQFLREQLENWVQVAEKQIVEQPFRQAS